VEKTPAVKTDTVRSEASDSSGFVHLNKKNIRVEKILNKEDTEVA
jgi:hypothetical protein